MWHNFSCLCIVFVPAGQSKGWADEAGEVGDGAEEHVAQEEEQAAEAWHQPGRQRSVTKVATQRGGHNS